VIFLKSDEPVAQSLTFLLACGRDKMTSNAHLWDCFSILSVPIRLILYEIMTRMQTKPPVAKQPFAEVNAETKKGFCL
jgi:hypothetical protein